MNILVASTLGVLSGIGPKPISYSIEGLLDDALLVAEVEVLDVVQAQWRGQNGETGKITVRVTDDPSRVFRGFRFLGQKLELVPAKPGPMSCTVRLAGAQDAGERLLVFVQKDRSIPVTARREVHGGQVRYRLEGYCDHNACWFRTRDKSLESPPGSLKAPNDRMRNEHVLLAGAMANRLRVVRRDAIAAAARFVLHVHDARLTGPELRAAFDRLHADDGEAAAALLARRGASRVREIRAHRERTNHPRARARLDRILERLAAAELGAALHDRCGKYPGAIPGLVYEALPVLQGQARRVAEARLRTEAEHTEPPLEVAGDGNVVRAWRERLGFPETR